MSEPDAVPLPREGEVFFDVRGDARSMRLSWYADSRVAVFSIWQGGRCTGTFRLPFADLARMIQTLQSEPSPLGADPAASHRPGPYGHPDLDGYSARDSYSARDGYPGRDGYPDRDGHPGHPGAPAYPQRQGADRGAGYGGDPGYAPGYGLPDYDPPNYSDVPRYPDTGHLRGGDHTGAFMEPAAGVGNGPAYPYSHSAAMDRRPGEAAPFEPREPDGGYPPLPSEPGPSHGPLAGQQGTGQQGTGQHLSGQHPPAQRQAGQWQSGQWDPAQVHPGQRHAGQHHAGQPHPGQGDSGQGDSGQWHTGQWDQVASADPEDDPTADHGIADHGLQNFPSVPGRNEQADTDWGAATASYRAP
jgi:hypothetical protein